MLRTLVHLSLALCLSAAAWAEDAPATTTQAAESPQAAAWCQANPEQCKETKQRMRDKCQADPERCAQFKAKAEEWRQRCAADPKACEEKKAKLRGIMERRAQRKQNQ